MSETQNTPDAQGFQHEPAQTLAFTDNISVAWSGVDTTPSPAQLAKVNESNELFLRAVTVLGSAASDTTEDDSVVTGEIARLDLKVNMLLDLVSQLIYAQSDIPPRTEVTVGAESLAWSAKELPQPGSTVFMQVYIQHGTPKPLCFYGDIVSTAEEHANGIARVNYQGLSSATRGWLEKLIFRHHRREVAYQRSHLLD